MKKLPTLHILNGDASVPAFTKANLPGQVVVWREILASGPAVYNIPETSFWDLRQQYITHNFQVSAEDYREKLFEELHKIENAGNFFEVLLWFDEDLVCQVNELYLLHQLYLRQPALVSICTSSANCIGNMQPEEMQALFEQRKRLEAAHLKQASVLWQLYAGPDPIALQSYVKENSLFSQTLVSALKLHLKRFPDKKTHLSGPHHLLLTSIINGAATIPEVQNSFWQSDPGYGYGDWQLQNLLQELSPELIEINELAIKLTETGKLVMEGKNCFEKDLTYWLGGVKINQQLPDWCWDEAIKEIILCTSS